MPNDTAKTDKSPTNNDLSLHNHLVITDTVRVPFYANHFGTLKFTEHLVETGYYINQIFILR